MALIPKGETTCGKFLEVKQLWRNTGAQISGVVGAGGVSCHGCPLASGRVLDPEGGDALADGERRPLEAAVTLGPLRFGFWVQTLGLGF